MRATLRGDARADGRFFANSGGLAGFDGGFALAAAGEGKTGDEGKEEAEDGATLHGYGRNGKGGR